jgi:hypothetical protein
MKALIHFAQRAGADADFAAAIRSVADELRAREAADGLEIVTLQRLADDPLGSQTPYHGTLDVSGQRADAAVLSDLLAGVGERLAEVADPASSTLLIGEDVVFVGSRRAPIRYQYLMRRRSDFDHASYLKRYREIHSEFGVRTPGILGYAQLHVDLDASRAAAERAGIGVWQVDSVSQLHLESLATFFGAVAKSPVPAEARADEERFVDRAHSYDFVSNVEWPAERVVRSSAGGE